MLAVLLSIWKPRFQSAPGNNRRLRNFFFHFQRLLNAPLLWQLWWMSYRELPYKFFADKLTFACLACKNFTDLSEREAVSWFFRLISSVSVLGGPWKRCYLFLLWNEDPLIKIAGERALFSPLSQRDWFSRPTAKEWVTVRSVFHLARFNHVNASRASRIPIFLLIMWCISISCQLYSFAIFTCLHRGLFTSEESASFTRTAANQIRMESQLKCEVVF